jgi:hypothetical protein
VAGWWGIPWGPIYTVQSLWVNLRGRHDVTPLAATALRLPIDKSTLYPEEGRGARFAGSPPRDSDTTHPAVRAVRQRRGSGEKHLNREWRRAAPCGTLILLLRETLHDGPLVDFKAVRQREKAVARKSLAYFWN